jgi:hypothetical protein
MKKKVKMCKLCKKNPVVEDHREVPLKWDYCKECFETRSREIDELQMAFYRKSQPTKKGNTLTEIEKLKELIEREKASVSILLSAASGHDRLEEDNVVMIMRDSYDRIEKMEKSLEQIGEMVL